MDIGDIPEAVKNSLQHYDKLRGKHSYFYKTITLCIEAKSMADDTTKQKWNHHSTSVLSVMHVWCRCVCSLIPLFGHDKTLLDSSLFAIEIQPQQDLA